MTTPHDPTGPRELTPVEEREVSALLADLAAAEEPGATPPQVVTRLDDVLAALAAERTDTPPDTSPGPVPDPVPDPVPAGSVLPLRPRRHRLPRVLLAAAAVVLGGYAVGNLATGGSLGELSGGDAGSSSAGGGQGDADQAESAGESLSGGEELSFLPNVRRDRLAADVRRVVRLFEDGAVTTTPEGDAEGEAGGDGEGGVVDETLDCPVPRLTDEQRLYRVRYAGRPAGLVVGPRQAGRVDVTVYSCRDGGVEVARAVPAP